MSSPYAPPPQEVPDAVPANRVRTSSSRTLAIWIVLIVGFVAFYRFVEPRRGSEPVDEVPRPAPVDAAPRPIWPWAIPPATAVVLALAFMRLRARLPAKYRTGELRELVTPKAEPVVSPAAVGPFELAGSDDNRPVRLRVDSSGFLWTAEARLLRPAQALEIGWEELEQVTTSSAASRATSIAIWVFVIGVFAAVTKGDWRLVAGVAPLAGVLALVGRRARRGTLTLVTPTHALTFVSRALTVERQAEILTAVRQRRPHAAPEPSAKGGGSVLRVLFVRPFEELGVLLKSDGAIRAGLARDARLPVGEEDASAGAVQRRLFALWTSAFGALLPVSFGLAAALSTGQPATFAVAWFVAWIGGLVAMSRLSTPLARLTGMSIVR